MKLAGYLIRSFLYFIIISSTLQAQMPVGYYNNAQGLTGNTLRTTLRNIVTNGHVKLPYTSSSFDVWNAYAKTDVRPAPNNTTIWDMYSDIPSGIPAYTFTIYTNQCGTASKEGDCYSREHCMPNSWWGGSDDSNNPQYTDLHHLFPSDQYVNMKKSNYPIGKVGSPTWTSTNGSKVGPCSYPGYTGTVFEPIDAYKGDFARAFFYLATRYMNVLSNWVINYPNYDSQYVINTTTNDYKTWFINMLIEWHTNDPVSSKEINRNDSIYWKTPQHNRNPFIDHPEYVYAIWGGLPLTIKAEPSNHVTNFIASAGNPSTSSIVVDWTDATGTTIPDGYLIKASSNGIITPPNDSIVETNQVYVQNVAQGTHTATFNSLNFNTIYTFKIYPYTNSGININYKINGSIPTSTLKTANIIKPEPTNQVTNFTSSTIYPHGNTIKITWTDAQGSIVPDGYLIKGTTSETFQLPNDSVSENTDLLVKYVNQGVQSLTIPGLNSSTNYSFQIYPYTNSGSDINYKTNGIIPTTTTATFTGEPSNHITNLTANYGNDPTSTITLNWTDASGPVLPVGYLIKGSIAGSINYPIDSIPEDNEFLKLSCTHGIQYYTFKGLSPGTAYTFKFFPYNNSVDKIDFKTDESVPSISFTTIPFTGIKQEPETHVENFTATSGLPTNSTILLHWTDVETGIIPDGYLIIGSSNGIGSIQNPVDNLTLTPQALTMYVHYGVRICKITGLQPNTSYSFKIFPYTNTGSKINYLTTDPVPAVSYTTTP